MIEQKILKLNIYRNIIDTIYYIKYRNIIYIRTYNTTMNNIYIRNTDIFIYKIVEDYIIYRI